MAKKKKAKPAKPRKTKKKGKVARKTRKAVKKRAKPGKAKNASKKAGKRARKIAVVEVPAEGKAQEEEDYAGAPEEELPGGATGESYEQPDYEEWEEEE
ncbi:MAG: hypothetical protein HYW05_04485 [Candidatus Diapherotrites archaeon]|nr:hypothetical protein [Candidatus Diapherotrites archaeon]